MPDYWGGVPYPTLTVVGVTWLYGYDFEIKVIARLPECPAVNETGTHEGREVYRG